MTDWIEHNGGPQPVGDDVWVATSQRHGLGEDSALAGALDWRHIERSRDIVHFRILNDHLIDAALKRGIRLGLKAAATTVCRREIEAARELAESGDCHSPTEGRFAGLAEATDLLRNLNPETIAKEAQHD